MEKSLSAQSMGSPIAIMAVCPLFMLSCHLTGLKGMRPVQFWSLKLLAKAARKNCAQSSSCVSGVPPPGQNDIGARL